MTRTARSLLLLALVMGLLVPEWPPAHAATARPSGPVPTAAPGADWNKDELLFHRTTGAFHIKNVTPSRAFGSAVRTDSVSGGWDTMVPIDLDGDRQDELMFYDRSSGRYRFHEATTSGGVGGTIRTGTFSSPWSFARAVDLDGDQRDELLLYRASTGAFRYLDLTATGAISRTIRAGSYATGYVEIAPIDLDGDEQDELLLYARSGNVRYVNLSSTAALGSTIRTTRYGRLSSIAPLDVDGDARDEIVLYDKSSGRYSIYDISATGALGTASSAGSLTQRWSSIAGINIDARSSRHPFVSEIIRLVNVERAEAGLGAVSSSTPAEAEALRWSTVMAAEGRIWHRTDLFHGLPANSRIVGENVASGYTSPAAVMAGWMASSGHRQNILNGAFTRIGVGVASDANGTLYFTQIFFGT